MMRLLDKVVHDIMDGMGFSGSWLVRKQAEMLRPLLNRPVEKMSLVPVRNVLYQS